MIRAPIDFVVDTRSNSLGDRLWFPNFATRREGRVTHWVDTTSKFEDPSARQVTQIFTAYRPTLVTSDLALHSLNISSSPQRMA